MGSTGTDSSGSRPRLLLTTTEAARQLGVTRPTVVQMCERGDMPYVLVGTHRRIEPEIVAALKDRPKRRLTASRRDVWLAHAAAGALVLDPERTLAAARVSLAAMLAAEPRGSSALWLRRWEQLLAGPLDGILDALTGRTVVHDELRRHSPLTAALPGEQRQAVLDTFSSQRRRPDAVSPALRQELAEARESLARGEGISGEELRLRLGERAARTASLGGAPGTPRPELAVWEPTFSDGPGR